MAKRKPGSGGIERLSSGRYRVRFRINGKRVPVEVVNTLEEAEGLLNALMEQSPVLQSWSGDDGETLLEFGKKFLDRRELAKHRAAYDDRKRWNRYVAKAKFATWPLRRIKRSDLVLWLDELSARRSRRSGKPLAVATLKNTLNLLRCCFRDALERGLIEENPARDVRVRTRDTDTGDRWTHLTPDEVAAFIGAAPAAFRPMIKVAVGLGLRSGEQWHLRIADVHPMGAEPHVVVRFGRKGLATKSGKPRVLPLFGLALEGVTEQLELVKDMKENGRGLLFPNEAGHPRTQAPRAFKDWLKAAKVTRNVRWHDLRHTCASTLLQGEGDERWNLTEIQRLLGHKQASTTERYAHFGDTQLKRAAQRTDAALQRRYKAMEDGPQTAQISTEVAEAPVQFAEFVNRRSPVQVRKTAPQYPPQG